MHNLSVLSLRANQLTGDFSEQREQEGVRREAGGSTPIWSDCMLSVCRVLPIELGQ